MSLYQQITDSIIAELEKGAAPREQGHSRNSMRNSGPCNVTIIAIGNSDSTEASKKIRIRGTGYGAQRHIDRWLAKGWDRVSVYVDSASTGKCVEIKHTF